VFNLFSTPAEQIGNEKCPKTGEPHKLVQRPDDTEETVAHRLKVYEEKTKPLIEFYREKGVLQSINAEGDVDEVTQRLESALRAASKASARKRAGAKPAAKKRLSRRSALRLQRSLRRAAVPLGARRRRAASRSAPRCVVLRQKRLRRRLRNEQLVARWPSAQALERRRLVGRGVRLSAAGVGPDAAGRPALTAAGLRSGVAQSPCNSLTLICASNCCISGVLWRESECWSGALARGATRGRITVNVDP